MHGELPAGSASHGKSTDGNTIVVDAVILLRRFQRFEYINFTGELERIGITPIRMQHDGIRGRVLSTGPLLLIDEVDFAQTLSPAMKPEIAAIIAFPRKRVIVRDDQSIRLHCLIDFGNIAPHDQPCLSRPGRFPFQQLVSPFLPLFQQIQPCSDFPFVKELLVLQRTPHCPVIDFHIGYQRFDPGILAFFELIQ